MWRAARGRAGAGLWSSTYPLRFHKWTEKGGKGRRRTLCPMFLLGGGGGRREEDRRPWYEKIDEHFDQIEAEKAKKSQS